MIIKFSIRQILYMIVRIDPKPAKRFFGWVGSHRRFDPVRMFVLGPIGIIMVR